MIYVLSLIRLTRAEIASETVLISAFAAFCSQRNESHY